MTKIQGKPLWYELSTLGDEIQNAQSFYERVLGWTFTKGEIPDFDYHLANMGGTGIAGMMANQMEGIPPNWLIYFGVDNCDAAVKLMVDKGAKVLQEAMDIPNTGRFAVLSDPQGAPIGILQPSDDSGDSSESPFDQSKTGFAQWHELMTAEPPAALDFYTELFGWSKGEAMDMGEMGIYQLFAHAGSDIGGMMGLMGGPQPYWIPYFGVDNIDSGVSRVKEAGGEVTYGPVEVPGGIYAAMVTDPQSAAFALLGPK